MDSRPELRFAYGDRRRNLKFGRSEIAFWRNRVESAPELLAFAACPWLKGLW